MAKVMSEHGTRVLVIERETQFQDRIRGEILNSWGVADWNALAEHRPMGGINRMRKAVYLASKEARGAK